MKVLVALLTIAMVTAHPNIESRITGGADAKAGTIKSFVALEIEFERGLRTCGGVLGLPENVIFTAASCVFDASEGKANTIRMAFGQSNDFTKNKIAIADVYKVSTYDAAKNTSTDDLAAIKLAEIVKTSSSIAGAMPSNEAKPDAFVGQSLVVCGYGVIDNQRNKTKSLKCTTLRAVPAAECAAVLAASAPATTTVAAPARRKRQDVTTAAPAAPPKYICTKNNDDKNACSGDFGAPVYLNMSGILSPVGVVSFFPNTRPNARCQDGHYTIVTQLGAYADFVKDPTAPPPTTVAPTTIAA